MPCELWLATTKLGTFLEEVSACQVANAHAKANDDGRDVEYEIRRGPVEYNTRRQIVGPDGPALGAVLTISDSALTVILDRPASGPTAIASYTLQWLIAGTWTTIAEGIDIFGSGNEYPNTGLTASTTYYYRCRATDTTDRVSEWSYSQGTTSAGAANQAPVWQAGTIALTVKQGEQANLAGYASDPDGDQLTFSKVSGGTTGTTVSATDHPLFRKGVADLIAMDPSLELIG